MSNCRPQISGGQCTTVKAFSTFNSRVIAKSMCSYAKINEIQRLGPYGLLFTPVSQLAQQINGIAILV